jgi:N-acetyl-1-D-myo-inositol-2-amino-2-deoxy-alpha-D-glucopyranoside deacetylase
VLFVHAHPDDETISTGATIATLVASGAHVSVLTCTRGERGEVMADDLKYLVASADRNSEDALGEYRVGELRAALLALGVTEHRMLGDADARWNGRAPRRYRDSGMRWGANGAEPLDELDAGSLSAAELGEVAADIAAVLIAMEPDVVVSYDADGGYGHPDHIRAHNATRTAAEVMGVPFYVIDSGGKPELTVDAAAGIERKRAALAAYRSQVIVAGDTFALGSEPPVQIAAPERFRRWRRPANGFAAQSLAGRIVTCALAAVLGVLVGVMGTVIHQASITTESTPVPWGLVVAILITAGLLVGLRLVFATRLVPAFAALGIVATQLVLTLAAPGGAALVPENPAGYVWRFAPVVIAVVAVAVPDVWRRRPSKIAVVPAAKGADPT